MKSRAGVIYHKAWQTLLTHDYSYLLSQVRGDFEFMWLKAFPLGKCIDLLSTSLPLGMLRQA